MNHRVVIIIDTDKPAFERDEVAEFARILKELAGVVATGYGQYNLARLHHVELYDSDGKWAGVVHVRKTFAGGGGPLDDTPGYAPTAKAAGAAE